MDTARSLRVLHVEDDGFDAGLVAAKLRSEGLKCEIVTVDTRERYEACLAAGAYDVILADDQLPSFDGLSALEIARTRAPETPFIFVSGTLGEEHAVERLKAGATDYVLKQRLAKLPGAVRRALAEAETRAANRRAQEQIQLLNVELEKRVRDRTADLEEANRILVERGQALRVSEERLQAILDHCPLVVVVRDLDGRLQFVNRQFERSSGLKRQDVLGKFDHQVFAPRLLEIYRTNDARALEAGTVVEAEEPAVQDPSQRVLLASRFPLLDLDGKPYALCVVAADITDRKRADDEIRVAKLEAERANRAKSEFLSRMSHDLRTPLNAVLGFAQILGTEPLTESQAECVQQIARGGRHLLDLINEVLDIARIEAGHLSLSPEPVTLGEILRYACDFMGPLAQDRGIALIVDIDAFTDRAVLADRQRLNQILLNLLSNAVKYNRRGGKITVHCSEPMPGRCRISVSDTGAGIPQGKLKMLFRPFERLGAETSGIEGTGLGLTLARGLAEAMGGSVGVESEVDKGSTFWVELAATEPVATPAHGSHVRHKSFETAPDIGPASILYIEDNVSNVRLMQKLLASRPTITLTHASDGRSGLALVREKKPNLILLDLHLPDMPGESVLYELWSDPDLRRIPVVVVSADATPGQMRRVIASGASAYLTKPLDLHHVLSVLDNLLFETGSSQGSIVNP